MADRTIVPAGFAQVTWHFSLPGDPEDMLTSLGYDIDTAPVTQTDVDDLTNAFALALSDMVAGNSSIVQADVVIGDANPPYLVQEFVITGVGFSGSDCDPPSVAGLIKKITARPGRQGRGRMFIPCMESSNVDNAGFITSTHVPDTNALLETFMAGHPYGTFLAPVLLHNDASPGPATPNEITSLQLQPKVATQRRRLRP